MIKRLLVSFIISLALLFWFFQSSINNYWLAQYNGISPLTKLDKYLVWQWGEKLNSYILNAKDFVIETYEKKGSTLTSLVNQQLQPNTLQEHKLTKTTENNQAPAENLSTKNTSNINCDKLLSNNHIEKPESIMTHQTLDSNLFAQGMVDQVAGNLDFAAISFKKQPSPISLTSKDQVLIIGDSLQQSVGRQIRTALSQQYKITSTDLSKQSTGLLNPNNLEWNKVVEQTLSKPNKYKLLVVLFGANDSYGMYDKVSNKAFPFGSDLWLGHYLQRVMSIMYSARSRNIAVIWIDVPTTRNRELNRKMTILNKLYHNAGQQYGINVINSDHALGITNGYYNAYFTVDGSLRKARADDGIHFTPAGARAIAQEVINLIQYKNEADLVNSLPSTKQNIQFSNKYNLTLAKFSWNKIITKAATPVLPKEKIKDSKSHTPKNKTPINKKPTQGKPHKDKVIEKYKNNKNHPK